MSDDEDVQRQLDELSAKAREETLLVLPSNLRAALARSWDAGHAAALTNEHEHRPGRQLTNPYRNGDNHE